MRSINKLIQKVWSEDQVEQSRNQFYFEKKIMRGGIPITIVSFIFFVIRIYGGGVAANSAALLYFSAALQLIVIGFVVLAFVMSFKKEPILVNINDTIMQKISLFLKNQERSLVYKNNCVTWHVGPEYYYLEIRVDRVKLLMQQSNQQQALLYNVKSNPSNVV